MFIELVESKRERNRSIGGTVASVALHTALISLAIAATASARTDREETPTRDAVIAFVRSRAETPRPAPRRVQLKPAAPQQPQAAPMTPPVAVATGVPEIPAASLPVSEAAPVSQPLSGTGNADGASDGTTGPLTSLQVDKEVRAFSSNRAPVYPEVPRARGIEGEVFARFVVSESGRVDMKSFEVISATGPAFANAVRYALERARFHPAEAGGRRVAQLVEQHFQFTLHE